MSKKPYFTLDYQFRLADAALREAENLLKAKYWTSSISQAYQVAHRCAAGLLFALEVKIATEREVGVGFESAYVNSGRSDARFAEAYKRLWAKRHKSDFDHDYVATREEAEEALALARDFHTEAQRLKATPT